MKISLLQILADGLQAGSVAGIGSAVAIAIAGQVENQRPIEAVNAVSHVAWGEQAFVAKELNAKNTLLGLAINDAAMLSWGVLFEALRVAFKAHGSAPRTVGCAAATGAIAYVVDYKIVPPRWMPGIERHLSNRALWWIYAAFVMCLVLGASRRRA